MEHTTNEEGSASRQDEIRIYGVSKTMKTKAKNIAKNHYGVTVTEYYKHVIMKDIDSHPVASQKKPG